MYDAYTDIIFFCSSEELHQRLKLILSSAMEFSDNKNADDITLAMLKWNQPNKSEIDTDKKVVLCSDDLKSIELIPTPDSRFNISFGVIGSNLSLATKAILTIEETKKFKSSFC